MVVDIILLKKCIIAAALGGSHERRLLNDLSLNYNKLERPVAEESEALEIRCDRNHNIILNSRKAATMAYYADRNAHAAF